jgi:PncC family amidohydrolase
LKNVFHPALKAETRVTALLVSESLLEEVLLKTCPEDIEWGTRVADDHIQLTLRGGSDTGREEVIQTLQDILGSVRIREGAVQPSNLLHEALKSENMTVSCAESCTGGLLGKMITDVSGASAIFWGSLVVYSNQAKERLLGVDAGELQCQGAVSETVVKRMAEGLLARADTDLGIAVTGIAGPRGGVPDKPVGTVWIAATRKSGETLCRCFHFHGNRDGVRRRSAVAALIMGECLVKGREFPQLESGCTPLNTEQAT